MLSAFVPDGPAVLSLGQLAAHAGIPKSTAHRVAATLVSEGALRRSTDGYELGLALFELGTRVRVKGDLRELALPYLEDLYEATHHTVHLAVLEGTDVVYVDRIRGHSPVRLPSVVGGRLPAHCTGVGKALLATTPGIIAALSEATLSARTPRTITMPAVLENELESIRRTGISIDREESTVGVSCVAAPVVAGGRTVAAISVSGPSTHLNVNGLTIAVQAAARGVSRALTGAAADRPQSLESRSAAPAGRDPLRRRW